MYNIGFNEIDKLSFLILFVSDGLLAQEYTHKRDYAQRMMEIKFASTAIQSAMMPAN